MACNRGRHGTGQKGAHATMCSHFLSLPAPCCGPSSVSSQAGSGWWAVLLTPIVQYFQCQQAGENFALPDFMEIRCVIMDKQYSSHADWVRAS